MKNRKAEKVYITNVEKWALELLKYHLDKHYSQVIAYDFQIFQLPNNPTYDCYVTYVNPRTGTSYNNFFPLTKKEYEQYIKK